MMQIIVSLVIVLGCFIPDPVGAQLRDLSRLGGRTLSTAVNDASLAVELQPERIIFVDSRERAVWVADFGLDSLWRVGGSGAGPGEFALPMTPRPNLLGGAVIADERNARALVVQVSGALSDVVYTRQDLGGVNPMSIRGIDAEGHFLAFARVAGSDSLGIVRLVGPERRRQQVAWWPQPAVGLGPSRPSPSGELMRELRTPTVLPGRTAWQLLPSGGIVLVRPTPYRVEIVRRDGRIVVGPTVRYAPVPISRAEKESYRRTNGPTADNMFPAVLPPFFGVEDVLTGPGDEIWVRRLGAWDASTVRYDVFGSDGARRGEVLFRATTRLIAVGREGLYLAHEDPNDGLIHLERITKPGFPSIR